MSEHTDGKPLDRALELLQQPPAEPDVRHGYLDLLGGEAPRSSGRVQNAWLSGTGSAIYDGLLRAGFALRERVRPHTGQGVLAFLDVPQRLGTTAGSAVLDVGSGPGNITRGIGRSLGESGFVVGIDVSPAMLERAVSSTTASNVVYARADASELPFRDATMDAVSCSACLQLLPDPFAAIGEMRRVLRPGGRIALTAPGGMTGVLGKVTDALGRAGDVHLFEPGALRQALQERGFSEINDRSTAVLHVLDATKPA